MPFAASSMAHGSKNFSKQFSELAGEKFRANKKAGDGSSHYGTNLFGRSVDPTNVALGASESRNGL